MNVWTGLLHSHMGRDKIIRATGFGLTLASGFLKGKAAEKLRKIATSLSQCRMVLRLFDDLPVLSNTLSYGWGKTERNLLIRILTLLENLASQSFFIFEHVAWLGQQEVVSVQTIWWLFMSLLMWLTSLVNALLSGLLKIRRLTDEVNTLKKVRETEGYQTEGIPTASEKLNGVKVQLRTEYLKLIKNGCDFACAVHWMPPGFLWAGKLGTKSVGFFGMTSSLIGLYGAYKVIFSRPKTG